MGGEMGVAGVTLQGEIGASRFLSPASANNVPSLHVVEFSSLVASPSDGLVLWDGGWRSWRNRGVADAFTGCKAKAKPVGSRKQKPCVFQGGGQGGG